MSEEDISTEDKVGIEAICTGISVETVTPGCELILDINREIKNLIFNYTLWSAVLGAFASNHLSLDNYTLPILALIGVGERSPIFQSIIPFFR